MTLDAYRDLFASAGTLYLDHAATGLLGTHVLDAATDYLRGRAGRIDGRSPNNFPDDLARIDRARHRAAQLVGAAPEAVCIVPNTSDALGLVAYGLAWAEGDRVAVPGCEFPANLLPWRDLARLGVEVDVVPHREATFSVDDVAAALTPRTRVLSVSAVQFLSGFRADLAALGELCRQRDILFVVDAIQAVGAVRLDVEGLGIDLLAVGGHKWLGSLQGGGFAVVSPRLMERLSPAMGWLNGPVDWDDFEATTGDLHPDATRFHRGTFPTAQLYALDATLGAMLDVGADEIERAVLDNAQRLAAGLDRLGFERYGPLGNPTSGIVTVRTPDPERIHSHLADSGVAMSMRSRLLRFAPHAHTRPDEVDHAVECVRRATEVDG